MRELINFCFKGGEISLLLLQNWNTHGFWPSTFYGHFIYYYETKWLLDTKKKDLQKACLFGNLFHFIDDLCAINDHI